MDLAEMANLVGNSAAHAALYPGQELVEREVGLYIEMASRVAERRTWNKREIAEFREKTRRRARSEIRRRMKEYGLDKRKFSDFLSVAEEYIEGFIKEKLAPKA